MAADIGTAAECRTLAFTDGVAAYSNIDSIVDMACCAGIGVAACTIDVRMGKMLRVRTGSRR